MAKSFRQFLEVKDIFGFEREAKQNRPRPEAGDDAPIGKFDSSMVLEELIRHPVNNKTGRDTVVGNTVLWGQGAGTIKVEAAPMGSDRITVRRLLEDLEGNPAWITKTIFPMTEKYKLPALDEHAMAQTILDGLNRIDSQLLEKPIKEWKGLEKLVLKLTGHVRAEAPDIFIYEGVRRLNPYLYIIYMSLRGHGVEAPDSQRVEEFTINVTYSEATGLIRCWGNDVASKTKQHLWLSQPSEWDEYFVPTQPEKEIVAAIINALKTY